MSGAVKLPQSTKKREEESDVFLFCLFLCPLVADAGSVHEGAVHLAVKALSRSVAQTQR